MSSRHVTNIATTGVGSSADAPAPPAASTAAMPVQLRRPGSGRSEGYTPTHGSLYAGSTHSRSCGRCGQFRPIVGTGWTKWRGLFVASCCMPRKPSQGPSKGHA